MTTVFSKVILKEKEEETSYGALIKPDLGREKADQYDVVAVGPGEVTLTGERIPISVKVGDVVLAKKGLLTEISVDGDTLYVILERDIAAILPNE